MTEIDVSRRTDRVGLLEARIERLEAVLIELLELLRTSHDDAFAGLLKELLAEISKKDEPCRICGGKIVGFASSTGGAYTGCENTYGTGNHEAYGRERTARNANLLQEAVALLRRSGTEILKHAFHNDIAAFLTRYDEAQR